MHLTVSLSVEPICISHLVIWGCLCSEPIVHAWLGYYAACVEGDPAHSQRDPWAKRVKFGQRQAKFARNLSRNVGAAFGSKPINGAAYSSSPQWPELNAYT